MLSVLSINKACGSFLLHPTRTAASMELHQMHLHRTSAKQEELPSSFCKEPRCEPTTASPTSPEKPSQQRGSHPEALLPHSDNATGTFIPWNVVIKHANENIKPNPQNQNEQDPQTNKKPRIYPQSIKQTKTPIFIHRIYPSAMSFLFYRAHYKVVTKTVNTYIHEIVRMDQIKPS